MSEQTPTTTSTSVLILSGISGSGKSVALTTLEDQGFYCIDNLPCGLVAAALKQSLATGGIQKLAIGIDARNRPDDLRLLPQVLSDLAGQGANCRLIFLDSREDVLLKRYSETRRRHPLSASLVDGSGSSPSVSLREAIARERQLMQPVALLADLVIDTSDLNVHQLRRKIITELGLSQSGLFVLFESFAYRKGLPNDADFVFDARGLPNPHWDARLRPLSGRDAPVKEWLESESVVSDYKADLIRFLERWLPTADSTERAYVTVAIGCTGGRHRSVYLVEALTAHFQKLRGSVLSFHRELG
jgi:RNase adapter protein RapZ